MYKEIFRQIEANEEQPNVELLNTLVKEIRANDEDDPDNNPIISLIHFLKKNPLLARACHRYLIRFVADHKQVKVFYDSGMINEKPFYAALSERIGEHLLVPLDDEQGLSSALKRIFDSPKDVEWLKSISLDQWQELFAIFYSHSDVIQALDEKYQICRDNITHVISMLVYRISGLSLETELMKSHPDLMFEESPFTALNVETLDFIEKYKHFNASDQSPINEYPDDQHVFVLIEQCQDVINTIHKNTKKKGVSIRLTNLIVRIEQSLERLALLFNMINPAREKQGSSIGELIFVITDHYHNQNSVRALFKTNTELLSLKVVDSASKQGEQYVSTDKKTYWSMYRKAAGAGFLIAFMATIKVVLGKFVFAPLASAFIYSMNYSIGFMLIHALHWKIATKQPALTASALASTIEMSGGSRKKAKLAELSQMIVDIMRTQFIAIMGNITIAMPIALAICYFWSQQYVDPMMSTEKAEKLLHGIDPLNSLSLFYAAITGVCLFLSGIIAGYYDNRGVYRNLKQRMLLSPSFNKVLGEKRTEKFANYFEKNFGSFAGNFWFGVMLGSIPIIGYIVGLPLDIRHIAFSSANLVQGLYFTTESHSIYGVFYLFLGVLLIGLTNLIVSFSLSLFVALRARKVDFAQGKEIFNLVLFYFLRHPIDFIWPTKSLENRKRANDEAQTGAKT